MKRRILLELLELHENWLSESYACVKWGGSWSHNSGYVLELDRVLSCPLSYFQYTLMTLVNYRIISLVLLLYCMLMTFYYWHRRLHLYRNYCGPVSRNLTQ